MTHYEFPGRVQHSSKILEGQQHEPQIVEKQDLDDQQRMKGFGGIQGIKIIRQQLGLGFKGKGKKGKKGKGKGKGKFGGGKFGGGKFGGGGGGKFGNGMGVNKGGLYVVHNIATRVIL